jgi:hypothetical protein
MTSKYDHTSVQSISVANRSKNILDPPDDGSWPSSKTAGPSTTYPPLSFLEQWKGTPTTLPCDKKRHVVADGLDLNSFHQYYGIIGVGIIKDIANSRIFHIHNSSLDCTNDCCGETCPTQTVSHNKVSVGVKFFCVLQRLVQGLYGSTCA